MDDDLPTTDDGFVICAAHGDRIAVWQDIRDTAEAMLRAHPHCFVTRAEFTETVFGQGRVVAGWTWERVSDVCAGLWEERQQHEGFPHTFQRIPKTANRQYPQRHP